DRFLQIHAVMHVMQEQQQRPLVLLIAARSAEGHVGLARLEREGWCEAAARPAARGEAQGQSFLEPEHLRPGAQGKSELRDGWRAVQPAAAWGGRDHIAPAVDDVDM